MATPSTERKSRRVFRAIADPARRKILDRLATQGESPALELGEGFRSSQPALSKHLKVLRDAGLVRVRREGRLHLYALDAGPLREVAEWIDLYQRFWSGRLDALGQYLDSRNPDEKGKSPKETR
ncbi:MAG: helix-turn-helix transcriptional regulator [Candidatus Eisenbacteria bacterium]|uniref:Helix-turn-helix transcriptional regulator n=1 Tax=Eiseniibacteriota bacterium TaxID=2212470 RepID=A0A956LZT9_UNCEI|nr:helix-turn-helix transcriptional regulator [Candidatus Eisenbacteria bacterium]